MAWLKSKIPLLILLFVFACTMVTHEKTFKMDPSITYPEERNVAIAVPVIPVQIEIIE